MKAERVFYFSTFVAGRQYYDADKVWPHLHVGAKVRMKAQPDNPKDPYAVEVWYDHEGEEYKLGYIPMRRNLPVSQLLRMGWGDALEAVISRLDSKALLEQQIYLTLSIMKKRNTATEKAKEVTEKAKVSLLDKLLQRAASLRRGGK